MSIEEVCGLLWKDFDLDKGVYAAIRTKTRRDRIPRAAVLWPETLAILKAMKPRGPHIFTRTHGTRYNKNTRVNDFVDLRNAAKLPDTVTFAACVMGRTLRLHKAQRTIAKPVFWLAIGQRGSKTIMC